MDKLSQERQGGTLSKEDRMRMRIASGILYPGTVAAKSSYYVKTTPASNSSHEQRNAGSSEQSQIAKRTPSYARFLLSMSLDNQAIEVSRKMWERKLVDALYHLYGWRWNTWRVLLPWVSREEVAALAASFGSESQWDVWAKRSFLETRRLNWRIEELDELIDWYPERQDDDGIKRVFIGNRSLSEIYSVATALELPTRNMVVALSKEAKKLL